MSSLCLPSSQRSFIVRQGSTARVPKCQPAPLIPGEPHDLLTKTARPVEDRSLPHSVSASPALNDHLNLFTRWNSAVFSVAACVCLQSAAVAPHPSVDAVTRPVTKAG